MEPPRWGALAAADRGPTGMPLCGCPGFCHDPPRCARSPSAPRRPGSYGVAKEGRMADEGFAVAVFHEGGSWQCVLLPPAVVGDLDACAAALRQQPREGGPMALVDVA